MTRPIFAALLTLGLCAPAGAGTLSYAGFETGLNDISLRTAAAGKDLGKAVARESEREQPQRLIESVLIAMNDAPGTGEEIVQWLRGQGAVVEFSDMVTGRSLSGILLDMNTDAKTPAIYINPKYSKDPVSYRFLGVVIAKEASSLMLKGYPDSAERAYMIATSMAHVYFELGGERIRLPDFDGIEDQELADTLKIWIENAGDPGVELLAGRGYEPLSKLLKQAQTIKAALEKTRDEFVAKLDEVETQEELAELRVQIALVTHKIGIWEWRELQVSAAIDYFEQFKKDDLDWIISHQGQLR